MMIIVGSEDVFALAQAIWIPEQPKLINCREKNVCESSNFEHMPDINVYMSFLYGCDVATTEVSTTFCCDHS